MTPGEVMYLRVRLVRQTPWPGDEKRTAAEVQLVSRVGVTDAETSYYVKPEALIPAKEAQR